MQQALHTITSVGYKVRLGTETTTRKQQNEQSDGTRCIDSSVWQEGDLIWVLKSKGRKRRQHPRPPQQQQDSSGQSCPQRLELFERARIIAAPPLSPSLGMLQHEVEEDDNGTDNSYDQQQNQTRAITITTPRIWIQYPKGSTYFCKQDRLLRVLEHDQHTVLVWSETRDYRRACLAHTLPENEAFIEIGCDHGQTVHRVASWSSAALGTPQSSFLVLGIDKAPDSIASAMHRYPQYPFIQWDCLDPKQQQEAIPTDLDSLIRRASSFVLAIDINGNRELAAVIACLQRLLIDLELRPRLIMVKSRALFNLLSS